MAGSRSLEFIAGGGDVGALMRAHDELNETLERRVVKLTQDVR